MGRAHPRDPRCAAAEPRAARRGAAVRRRRVGRRLSAGGVAGGPPRAAARVAVVGHAAAPGRHRPRLGAGPADPDGADGGLRRVRDELQRGHQRRGRPHGALGRPLDHVAAARVVLRRHLWRSAARQRAGRRRGSASACTSPPWRWWPGRCVVVTCAALPPDRPDAAGQARPAHAAARAAVHARRRVLLRGHRRGCHHRLERRVHARRAGRRRGHRAAGLRRLLGPGARRALGGRPAEGPLGRAAHRGGGRHRGRGGRRACGRGAQYPADHRRLRAGRRRHRRRVPVHLQRRRPPRGHRAGRRRDDGLQRLADRPAGHRLRRAPVGPAGCDGGHRARQHRNDAGRAALRGCWSSDRRRCEEPSAPLAPAAAGFVSSRWNPLAEGAPGERCMRPLGH